MTTAVGKNEGVFEAVSEQVRELLEQGRPDELAAVVAEYASDCRDESQKLLLEGVRYYGQGHNAEAVASLRGANELLGEDSYPANGSIYSAVFVNSQLALSRRERPATQASYRFCRKNLAALQAVDAVLAAEVQKATMPAGLGVVDYWGGLHVYDGAHGVLWVLFEKDRAKLAGPVKDRWPIAFGGTGSGQEVRYCLKHRLGGLHGMERGHYLFEPEAGKIKLLLHLEDFSQELRTWELMLFGGEGMERRIREVFGTLRYAPAELVVGNGPMVAEHLEGPMKAILAAVPSKEVERYYASEAFRVRQQRIAAGQVMPRVLVHTCRWTTFLKHCAADFAKAFGQVGCETRFFIEERDVETPRAGLVWRMLDEFRPDVVFIVSNARPVLRFVPRELPFIGYIQDKCGQIEEAGDLSADIGARDLFVCMLNEFQRYLAAKQVPIEQTFVMPIPADETMFYPLGADGPLAERFGVDVSFVKHGHAEVERVFGAFLREHTASLTNEALRADTEQSLRGLYEAFCGQGARCHYEREMLEFVRARMGAKEVPAFQQALEQMVAQFYIRVYSAAWRCRFLEALDGAGMELGLYGNSWAEHARLGHLDRGPVDRETELNAVYNFSKINLSINHSTTMHQRLSECGLAGGFMMVADHPEESDWGPARPFFAADREVVFFRSAKELMERCRYYLAHEQERRQIAENMHQRALAEQTCRQGAAAILRRWRELLIKVENRSVK